MKSKNAFRILFGITIILVSVEADAGNPRKSTGLSGLAKTATNDIYRPILINNIFSYYSNNGDGSWNPYSPTNEGFEFPKGKDLATNIFEEGVVWGCKQAGVLKVGGSVYRHGLQAGPIISYGTSQTLPVADDPSNPANRVYRVRRDIRPIQGVTDPSSPLAAAEKAIIANSEVQLISRYQALTAEQLLQQYWNDWVNWPAAQGAPYTDVDHNGSYDPTIDIPGVPLSDQTLFYVANDLDPARAAYLAGSAPIGLEMRKTIWAYNLPGALGNTVFTSTRLINKSGIALDSMYVTQWSDPDVGNGGDDFVGCDTLLGLGYAYNSSAVDANLTSYGLIPPAVGFDLLQGPMVQGASTDTAIFGLSFRPGFKNLPMSSFVFLTQGDVAYADPIQGPGGDIQWYRTMMGTTPNSGAPFISPLTGKPTLFPLSGDPVSYTGWNDGNPEPPQDRRMSMASGPFSMAPGDTQEIVVACLASRGITNLTSITALKDDDRLVTREYHTLFRELPPQMSYSVTKSPGQASVSVQADARDLNVTDIKINIGRYNGLQAGSISLADDGLHNDGAAGDGIFGGTVSIPQYDVGLEAEAVITYHGSDVYSWEHALENITTASVGVHSYAVASDNINNDGIANPGENVRYVFSLQNASQSDFSNLLITTGDPGQRISLSTLLGTTTYAPAYDPYNPSTYLSFDVPSSYRDSTWTIVLATSDQSHDQWTDTLVFPVSPLRYALHSTPLTHALGNASGSFSVLIVDSTHVKNHLYAIRGVDSSGSIGYTIIDSTIGLVLIHNHALPDSLGHTSPIVDGFKLLRGSIDSRSGMIGWSVPSGQLRFSSTGGAIFGLEGFTNSNDPNAPQNRNSGTIGMASNLIFGGIGTTLQNTADFHDVLIKWASVPGDTANLWDPNTVPADTNYSLSYRYLRSASTPAAKPSFLPWIQNVDAGYPYQGYVYGVPFSAWDMSYNPPHRLAVGHMENNAAGGLVDGRYWPALSSVDNGATSGPRELCFIYSSPYTGTPVAPFNMNISNNATMPIMWVLTCARKNDPPYAGNDQFEILVNHLPSPQDLWTFNPSILTSAAQARVAASFALLQNFPNPFNPSTTIRYEIAAQGKVTMHIYNVLGQVVRTLVNEVQNPGAHTIVWNSRNDAGNVVASGVYFYRCEVVPSNGAVPVSRTMKMVLVK